MYAAIQIMLDALKTEPRHLLRIVVWDARLAAMLFAVAIVSSPGVHLTTILSGPENFRR